MGQAAIGMQSSLTDSYGDPFCQEKHLRGKCGTVRVQVSCAQGQQGVLQLQTSVSSDQGSPLADGQVHSVATFRRLSSALYLSVSIRALPGAQHIMAAASTITGGLSRSHKIEGMVHRPDPHESVNWVVECLLCN